MIKNIQCITLPRSGHHLLTNLLFKYFSNNLDYPEIQGHETDTKCKDVIRAGNFCYCEFYNHCQKTPCSDLNTNFQKNHDLDLRLENNPSYSYIIQFRHPLESLISRYNLKIKKSKEDNEKIWFKFLGINLKWQKILKNFPQIRKKLLYLMPLRKKLKYSKRFINKWALENKNPNTYFLPYDKLITNPNVVLKEVIEFINPGEPVDTELINSIVKCIEIKQKSNLSNFKYYDEYLFKTLEKKLKNELEILALKTYQ